VSDWLLFATICAFVAVCVAAYAPLRLRLHSLALLVVAAAALGPPVYTTRRSLNTDIDNFRRTGELVLSSEYVYGVDFGLVQFHPYLPLQMYASAAAAWIADHSTLPFSMALKAPNVAAAALLALFLLAAARRLHPPDLAWFAPLAFVLNPAAVMLTAYHGQFDVVPAVLAFGAWYAIRFGPDRRWLAASAALLGLAILAKTWPVVLVTLLAQRLDARLRSRVIYVAGALAIPAAATAAYVLALEGSWLDLRRAVFDYRGVNGLSGYSMILQRIPGSAADLDARREWVDDYGRAVFFGGVLCATGVALAARLTLERAITLTLVAFYVFAPAGALSYFVWVLPFALISGERFFPALFGLTAVVSRCSVLCYDHVWTFTPDWWLDRSWYPGAGMWVVMVAWLLWLLGGVVRALYDGRQRTGRASRAPESAAEA